MNTMNTYEAAAWFENDGAAATLHDSDGSELIALRDEELTSNDEWSLQ